MVCVHFALLKSCLGCDCPEEFWEVHCERSFADPSPRKCTLQCLNGGICRSGPKDNTDFIQRFESFGNVSMWTRDHIDWQHCVCPEGYFGVQCEWPYEVCGSSGEMERKKMMSFV
jgi:hypothetical protein